MADTTAAPAPSAAPAPAAPATPPPAAEAASLLGGEAAAAAPAATTPPAGAAAAAAVLELKLPEGMKPEAAKDYLDFAKANGLSQAQAQAMFDTDRARQAQASVAEKTQRLAQAQQYVAQLKADPEFGGGTDEGFKSALLDTKAGVDKFGGPELVKALEAAGLGSHPAVVKAFCRVGRAGKDDSLLGTLSAAAASAAAPALSTDFVAERLYPNTKFKE